MNCKFDLCLCVLCLDLRNKVSMALERKLKGSSQSPYVILRVGRWDSVFIATLGGSDLDRKMKKMR
jgi:hypothetical protein